MIISLVREIDVPPHHVEEVTRLVEAGVWVQAVRDNKALIPASSCVRVHRLGYDTERRGEVTVYEIELGEPGRTFAGSLTDDQKREALDGE